MFSVCHSGCRAWQDPELGLWVVGQFKTEKTPKCGKIGAGVVERSCGVGVVKSSGVLLGCWGRFSMLRIPLFLRNSHPNHSAR